jgi:uncharacterized protein
MKQWMLCILAVVLMVPAAVCEDDAPVRLLISGGGDWHPYGQASGALIDALRKVGGFSCSYSEDDNALRYEQLRQFDVLVLYNGVYYEGTENNQKEPTPDFLPTSLEKFVQNGGGLVCIHSAIASYSDWKGFIDLIGGVWDWKTSLHDPYGILQSDVVAPAHPILEGIPMAFSFPDEFYHTLVMKPGVKVLIESTHEKGGKLVTEPLAWVARDQGKERVVTILHGHDMGSWGNETFHRLMTNAILWAAKKK